MGTQIYRPPQWNQALGIATLLVIFPGQTPVAQYSNEGIGVTLPNASTTYVFDITPRVEHEQRITKTKHPVQTGASISDHAYVEPARLVVEVRMSDSVDAYQSGVWIGGPTKSVSAYQILLAMSFARIPMVVVTRLRTYNNMIVSELHAEDTSATTASLKATFVFEEIFVAQTQTVAASARPQTTGNTGIGTVSPSAPTSQESGQYGVSNPDSTAIGAGDWSSNNYSGANQGQ